MRDPATHLDIPGSSVSLVRSDLSDVATLADQMRGCDAVIHAAGQYRVGIRTSERPAMWDANVGATERVLDAAVEADVTRIVHLSTVNTFGDTRGKVVDETWQRNPGRGFLSYYDETKWHAHRVAEDRIARGAPVVIAMPGVTIGPGDHSGVGQQLREAHDGTLRYVAAGGLGIVAAHADDVAAGILATLDLGRAGRAYMLAGEPVRMREALGIAARVGGRRLPRLRVPDRVLQSAAPFAARIPGPIALALRIPENMHEVIRAAVGVTYWASSARARAELGFAPRDLETAIRDTFRSA